MLQPINQEQVYVGKVVLHKLPRVSNIWPLKEILQCWLIATAKWLGTVGQFFFTSRYAKLLFADILCLGPLRELHPWSTGPWGFHHCCYRQQATRVDIAVFHVGQQEGHHCNRKAWDHCESCIRGPLVYMQLEQKKGLKNVERFCNSTFSSRLAQRLPVCLIANEQFSFVSK